MCIILYNFLYSFQFFQKKGSAIQRTSACLLWSFIFYARSSGWTKIYRNYNAFNRKKRQAIHILSRIGFPYNGAFNTVGRQKNHKIPIKFYRKKRHSLGFFVGFCFFLNSFNLFSFGNAYKHRKRKKHVLGRWEHCQQKRDKQKNNNGDFTNLRYHFPCMLHYGAYNLQATYCYFSWLTKSQISPLGFDSNDIFSFVFGCTSSIWQECKAIFELSLAPYLPSP